MSAKPKRPRPGQDRARQIHKAGCHVVRICGRPWEGMDSSHTYGGGFHVSKYEAGGSVVIDICPVKDEELAPDGSLMTEHKVCGLELKPDGTMYIRSFKRGAWEAKLLAYAATLGYENDPGAAGQGDGSDAAHKAIGIPTGAGKTLAMSSIIIDEHHHD
jgi:hypothetical protein